MSEHDPVILSSEGQQRKQRILDLAIGQAHRRRRRVLAAKVTVGLVAVAVAAVGWGLLTRHADTPSWEVAQTLPGAPPTAVAGTDVAAGAARAPPARPPAWPAPVGGQPPRVREVDDRQLVTALAKADMPACVIRVNGRTHVYYARPGSSVMQCANP